jgi:hypothetical protein
MIMKIMFTGFAVAIAMNAEAQDRLLIAIGHFPFWLWLLVGAGCLGLPLGYWAGRHDTLKQIARDYRKMEEIATSRENKLDLAEEYLFRIYDKAVGILSSRPNWDLN